MIKVEQKFDSVISLGESFLGLPEENMTLTWDELCVETHLRDVITSEIDDHVIGLESMNKRDISVSAFNFAFSSVENLMLDLKALHAGFRRKAAENGLLENESFKEDSRSVVKFQVDIWNRLDRLRPKGLLNPASGQAASVNQQGSVLLGVGYTGEKNRFCREPL